MRIFKILKSNQGISLVEVLMAVGVLGIGVLALVNLTQNTAKDTRSVDLNGVKAQYFNSFKEFINSRVGCEGLVGKTFNNNYSNITFDSTKLPKIVREKYFEIKSIQAKRLVSTETIVDSNTLNSSLEVKLTLDVFKNSKKNTSSLSGTGGSGGSSGAGAGSGAGSGVASVSGQESYYFIIPTLVNTAGEILNCDVERTQDLACRAVGGKLDDSGKCSVEASCKLRGSFVIATGALSTHQKLNPVNSSYSCPTGSDQIQTGSMDFKEQDPPGSKKGSSGTLVYGSASFFTCIECPPGTTTTVGGGGGGSGGGGFGGGGGSGFGFGSGSI
jgi:hypothetical protein